MAGTATGSETPETGAAGSTPETGDKKSTTAAATAASAAPATGADSGTPDGDGEAPLTPQEARDLRASNERMEKALKDANKESEKHRKDAKALETAKLTAEEQVSAELAELKTENEALKVEKAEFLIERVVTRLTPKLGLVDPEAVTRLIDWDDLQFDEGVPNPDVIETAVKTLLEKRPYLAAKAAATPATRTGNNATDATSGSGSKPDLTAAELAAANAAGMTPEHYSALKDLNKGGRGVTLADYQGTRRTGAGGTK